MQHPGFIKRLVVVIYDGLLLCGAILFTSLLVMALFNALAPASFYMQAVTDQSLSSIELSALGRRVGGVIVTTNALAVSFLFYGWFWTHGGQTLGMKAWNLYLVRESDGKFISWPLAAKRFLFALLSWAILGLGFLWVLFTPKRQTWHDMATQTMMVFHKDEATKK